MNSRISKIENPIRGELFSLERLETHAESLAIAQQITVKSTKSRKLLPRVKENGRILTAGYRAIAQAVREERAITPAAEWLVDNFYIVEEQIREIMDDLPPGFYRRLPKLSEGPLEGYPRVYGIAWAYVAHTDSRVDREWLKRFVLAYQRVGPLYIGEIWALAISLRIVLVENLRRITDSIVAGKAAREEADALADAVLGYKSDSGAARFKKLPDGTVDTDLALRTYDRMELPRAFAVQLVQRLRDGEGRVVTALHWLDRRLSTDGTTAEKIVQAEHQDQTAMNTTVRNIITSMRLLSSMDWSQFFEEVSAVDELLRAESAFAAMDFQTRDLYRHAVEELARGAQIPEVEVVRRILAKTQQAKRTAAENPTLDYARQSDPGYYLIGQGRPDFEQAIQFDVSPLQCARRLLIRFATPIYLGSFFSATALFIAWPLHYSAASGLSPWALTALGLLGLIPASDLALALLNSVVTDTVRPEILPKLDFPLGIPDHLKTLIVVPTLLTDVASIKEQIERLEIHYLCNADGHLQFALLTDWMDAHQEHQADDEALLKTVTEGIQRLNAKWGPGPTGRTRFYVFHRKRTWNAQEQVWMGWERKRGKLQELNRLLRGKTPTTFMGVLEAPSDVRYVITLDADTHLSRGSAYRLVGAMAHPLNRPQFDPISGRVVQGYGLMQPRITPTLPTDGRGSRYQEIFSGPMGVDPYAFAVSDVYQDLYKEGSYVGKGIYDLDAFESSLAGRVPENTMLSHDLFEGVFVRTALLTDVEFFEEFPGHYEVAATRNHRWVRGDWQLIPLIFTGRLAIISRWKMIDNLRRSLSAPSAYLALIAAWIMKDAPVAAVWMSFILSTLALPPLIPVLVAFMPRNRRISLANHWRGAWTDLQLALTQFFLAVVFLPHQAWIMTDAIVRTLYRLLISRRHLLEWRTAALSKNIFAHQLMAYYGRMKSAWILALLAALAVGFSGSEFGVWGVVPFFCLWVLSPWIARHISTPMNEGLQHQLSQESRQAFRRIARKTWRFFETFVTAKQHWLPPDNFQEIPTPVLAHRTSPTNIGLYLLSVLSAHDLGWVGLTETVERLEKTLATMQALPQYQGHLFNWYDTDDLRALEPLYISTVDSGNLAGHLWTVARACRAYIQTPLPNNEIFDGLQDVLQILAEREKELPAERRRGLVSSGEFKEALTALSPTLEALRAADPALPIDWRELKEKSTTLLDIAHAISIVGRPQAADMKTGPSEEEPSWQPAAPEAEIVAWAELFAHQWQSHSRDSAWSGGSIPQAMKERLQTVAALCDEFVNHMRFGFLCDPVKKIFSIGYQMNEQKLDASYYDLLASEARLASFVAIAKGDLPAEHWFRLSRTLSPVNRGMALLSWSGSMFEYLMPELIMRPPVGSLLDQTCRTVVRRQMEYGEERKVPWGISESGYNAQNLEFTYQYSNFGVPGLGLRRGLSTDLLIAPYATALASMIDPAAALKNFQRLSAIGAEGRYGFYEALDYTPTRLPENQPVAIVREFMAHHQGMSLTAILNVLHGGRLAHYFHAEPRVQATELLLQERTPREVPVARIRMEDAGEVRAPIPAVLRRFYSPHDVVPRTHLLSNGHYSVMITSAGSGYSRWRNLAVTRWREDATRDITGTYIFLRDAASGAVWSAGFQPTGVAPDRYEVDFSEDRAEIIRWDGDMITTLEVVVSPEDDAEIRRLAIKNTGSLARTIEVTSYAEIVLATPAADLAHPAFSNLFVQTEYVPEVNGLICSRRPRSPDEAPVWAAHVVVVEGKTIGDVQYESDRAAFLGRGRAVRTPLCVMDGKPLSNTAGAVLDPVVSLRRRILALPGETVHVTFATVIATSRDQVLGLADKYHDPAMFERAVTLAWTHAHIQQHHLGILPSEAHVFQNLASRILYSDAGLRPARELLERNRLGQPGLWAYSISGDLPIVLVRIDEEDDRDIVREILRAHEYWRMKNLAVDLVILNEKGTSYASELQNALEALVRTTQDALRHEAQGAHAATEGFVSKSGGIYVLRADRLSTHDRILLLSAARVILLSRHGTLAQQLERLDEDPEEFHALPLAQRVKNQTEFLKNYLIPPSEETDKNKTNLKRPTLQFFNGWGGFSDDGRDYVITLGPGQWTPAPWINVISNPIFGFQVSESGSGYCWSGNSRENQLTPWSNDPVSDPSGEVFYIRDEESGEVWTPTALPIRLETEHYMARHGQGYSEFTHQSHGILSELMQFVPLADPLKISRLRLTNTTKRDRRISVTAYVEWVLGSSRSANGPFIVTELDSRTQAIFVRNAWNTEFSSRVAFADLAGEQTEWTGDRTEFIGRNGTLAYPAALGQSLSLSGHLGAGFDPCTALRRSVDLESGESVEVLFFIGQAENAETATELIQRYRQLCENPTTKSKINRGGALLRDIERCWDDDLGAVQVTTPDNAMNVMLNRWLLYQTQVCRLWSRAAFYQAGGAYGFRDQLQDVMALIVSRRDLAREHILRAAARQFKEGDVQHWWHPPTGRGVRTRISDDLIWLPYVICHYLEVTEDFTILDEPIPFIGGQAIAPGKEDAYFQPETLSETATLFEHAARTLDRSLAVGAHGLPLMGTGDWNDGMNRVGFEGQGESIWLGWFLHSALWEFAKIAEKRGESERAEKWRLHVSSLKAALEQNGWDGDWYRRAYFDNGSPLGSASNQECQIDSIAQSWGVLSGAADPARAARAMAAVYERLVRKEDKLVLLFTPPFQGVDRMVSDDKPALPNPGYIQGYLPGVRENGGQYTHAAVWAVLAFAAIGDGDKAGELFSLLNPIHHGATRSDIHRYKVEPYVAAGDVYAESPHVGRGGWTWYTGSAGWMYRAGMEWILGFRLRGTQLFMDPCIPKTWKGFELTFRYHSARYAVKVENPNGVSRGIFTVDVDGKPARVGSGILLRDDGAQHSIHFVLG